MLGGLFEETVDMLKKKRHHLISQVEESCCKHISSLVSLVFFFIILFKPRYWYLFCLFYDPFSDGGFKVNFHIAHI